MHEQKVHDRAAERDEDRRAQPSHRATCILDCREAFVNLCELLRLGELMRRGDRGDGFESLVHLGRQGRVGLSRRLGVFALFIPHLGEERLHIESRGHVIHL